MGIMASFTAFYLPAIFVFPRLGTAFSRIGLMRVLSMFEWPRFSIYSSGRGYNSELFGYNSEPCVSCLVHHCSASPTGSDDIVLIGSHGIGILISSVLATDGVSLLEKHFWIRKFCVSAFVFYHWLGWVGVVSCSVR